MQDPGRAYFLATARLGFGRWTTDDWPLAWALWGDPEVSGMLGGPFSKEQVRARLEREIDCQATHGVQYWPIFLLDGGSHAGCAGLRPYRPEEGILELGYHLRRDCWGRGLATEAAQAVVRFAFDTLGVRALFAGHHPANDGSRRVLEKLGFQFTHEEPYGPTLLLHPSYLLRRP
jgi:RimJ/RimL family protein N-acetyltransferase